MFPVILLCAVVIFSAIFTNKFIKALGIPSLLFFMCLGMIFGSDGIFKIHFEDFTATKELCSIALGFIIFYGGFCTKWKTAKPIAAKAAVLSTVGVFLTAILTCIFCHYVLNVSFLESFLIGAVISSTDAASVFSILKSRNLNLKENTAPLLEIESGSNDPMSYILVILAITLLQGQSSGFVFVLFLKQMVLGILIGVLIAKAAMFVFEKTKLITEGNDTLFVIALVLFAYALPEFVNGNPFLAVYFLGIILGNAQIRNKFALMNFFDGITKLGQIGIFFILGLLAFPSKVPGLLYTGTLIFFFLTFIARPIAVFGLLLPFRASISQCLLVSWAGLRGVASIVFAIIAVSSSVTLNYDLFHLVFLISILSVALQGTLLPWVAQKTGMIDEYSDVRKTFNDYQDENAIRLMKMIIDNRHEWQGKEIKNIMFPEGSLALIILRGNEKIIPKGNTVIEENDTVVLSLPTTSVADDIVLKEVSIDKNHKWHNKKIKNLNLNKNDLIVMIKRDGENIVPNGEINLLEDDLVVIYN